MGPQSLRANIYIHKCLYIIANTTKVCHFGIRGSKDGAVVEHLPSTQGFDSRAWRHMWVEFVVVSRPCSERFFSGYSGFPLSSKTNISKFHFYLEFEGHRFVSRIVLLRVTLFK